MTRLLAALVELLFPRLCLSCGRILSGRGAHPFCPDCHGRIRFIRAPICPTCGMPYPVREGPHHPCGECILKPPSVDAARSLGVYESVLHEMIHSFKYGGNLTIGGRLGRLMAEHEYPSFRMADYSLLLPVPLHPRRLKKRGFNQSVILAREISKRQGIAMDFRALKRTIDTDSQTGLKKQERQANMKNVFSLPDPETVRGRRVLLVDDVYTTGSTLGECARVLLEGGAEAVGALTLARAIQEPT